MNPDIFRHKRLIARKNREAEDRRMNEVELSFKTLFILVIVLALIAFYLGQR